MQRFSLKALLILVTAIAVLLGYSQWRRQWIRTTCDELARNGYPVSYSDEWVDFLWQRTPTADVKVTGDIVPNESGGAYYEHFYWVENGKAIDGKALIQLYRMGVVDPEKEDAAIKKRITQMWSRRHSR